ncbi:MAG: glycoside hydrolase family 1 protein [Candidatus Paceibacterota bacterium]
MDESKNREKRITINFPKDFFWGSATSAYQVEGNILNNDWAIAAKDGKVPNAGLACDHYNRFTEDFDIVKSLGQNSYRFSVEWSRIEPEEGKFNEDAINHYREVINDLKSKGLEPFLTLWHFTLPDWFSAKGGFLSSDATKIFSRYCEYVVSKFGDDVVYFTVMNEPMVYAQKGFFQGQWPPFKKNIFKFLKVILKLQQAHVAAYKAIKSINYNCKVGIVPSIVHFKADNKIWNKILSNISDWFWNYRFISSISAHTDFIGVNYYSHHKFGENVIHEKTDMDWVIYPAGIYFVLKKLATYNKPLIITENGIADIADNKRAKFITDHLWHIGEAILDGVPVIGYFYWSLLDNYEWSFGFDKKFGLVRVDFDTQKREILPSAFEYKKVCENNSLSM